ncbi:hypothetical protein C8R45DRAFT_1220186 [Mycena sanguinolenta]|nr:hypothetical protein C8R45DRAFT_1220186 [Mycena sanguinolenta]
MFPPELVELIIDHAWGCLSTSSHQHGLSMTRWMLVSHDWLKIVLSMVCCDLWITSDAHLSYIVRMCNDNASFICGLAGIADIRQHLIRTCRFLIISVYHSYQGEYMDQCSELIEYATTEPRRDRLFSRSYNYGLYRYAVPTRSIATFIARFAPGVRTLHFVLIDCTATYRAWNTTQPSFVDPFSISEYPVSLVELYVTFAYTSPPPALLIGASRGIFFPPPSRWELPIKCRFYGVKRLVVRDANADFVAFLTTACPRLQKIESTAEFSKEDVPEQVSTAVRDRLVFVRLPRTVDWGLTGSTDALPLPPLDLPEERPASPASTPLPQVVPPVALQKRKNSIWRWRILAHVKHVLRERN